MFPESITRRAVGEQLGAECVNVTGVVVVLSSSPASGCMGAIVGADVSAGLEGRCRFLMPSTLLVLRETCTCQRRVMVLLGASFGMCGCNLSRSQTSQRAMFLNVLG